MKLVLEEKMHLFVWEIVILHLYHGLILFTPTLVLHALLSPRKRLCFIGVSSEESGVCFTWEVHGEKYKISPSNKGNKAIDTIVIPMLNF